MVLTNQSTLNNPKVKSEYDALQEEFSLFGELLKARVHAGLTQAEVDAITAPGACECCGSKELLCIDHCHDTEKPRGLLCHKCNTALGLLDDDSQRMLNLIRYLERSKPLE